MNYGKSGKAKILNLPSYCTVDGLPDCSGKPADPTQEDEDLKRKAGTTVEQNGCN
jgi:hypothetical protein